MGLKIICFSNKTSEKVKGVGSGFTSKPEIHPLLLPFERDCIFTYNFNPIALDHKEISTTGGGQQP
jgi:hypothetical protein